MPDHLTSKELLPCAHCGGAAQLTEVEPMHYVVECSEPMCNMSTRVYISAMDDSRPLAIEAWNRRVADEPEARHTLDCDMVKHPNCTRCNCGSSIDTESHSGRPRPGEKSACLPADDRGIGEARSSESGNDGIKTPDVSIQSREPVGSNSTSGGAGEHGALDTRSALTPPHSLPAEPPSAGVKCTHCNGNGYNEPIYDEQDGWTDETPCETCNGSGRITTVEQYLKTLPANWHEDSSLETWFPITAEELKRLKDERASQPPKDPREERLREAFLKCRQMLATQTGTFYNAAHFGLTPEDIGMERASVTKESSLGDEHACGECGHIECRSAHETSSPRWKRADKLWSEYPIGTVARQSWTGCKWTKNERGWKAHAGDTFPIPGGADEVAVSEQGEPTADETNDRLEMFFNPDGDGDPRDD